MNISDLTEQELVSAIERLTGFRFGGPAWCVCANAVPKNCHTEDPDGCAIGITYWGDSNADQSRSTDLMALCAFDALSKARENLVKDGVAEVTDLAVFVGRAALQKILSRINEPGGSGSIRPTTPRKTQGGR